MSKARWEAAFWITIGAMLTSAYELSPHWWMGIPLVLGVIVLHLCLRKIYQ